MGYPLDVGGRDDYPVKVGSMLLTMVDPHPGYEVAYNRWYERDHYYEGCMIGPYLFAGSRWVAPRALKDKRWPPVETVARPYNAGSYVSIYWVQKDHAEDHFTNWASPQVHWIYANGRGFAERRHIHTSVFDYLGVVYRDADGVPVDLALDARYDGVVAIWLDAASGDANALQAELAKDLAAKLVAGSTIESVSSWTPRGGDASDQADRSNSPMDLGTRSGGAKRLVQLAFVRGPVEDVLSRVKTYTDAIEKAGLATLGLVAPFYPTAVGTDKYADQLDV